MPIPSAQPAPPPATESAETHALIAQISAEARASGQSLTFDPDAPAPDGESDGEAEAPAVAPKPAPKKAAEGTTPQKETPEDANEDEEGPSEDPEADPEAEDEGQAQGSGQLDEAAVRAALSAEGGVDMLALAQALGVEVESLNVSPGASKFLRLERKKADETLAKAHDMAQRLERDYGDQVKARHAAEQGDIDPAIKFIEATFGMTWNELNKMVAGVLQGKPPKDLEKNRELHQLRRKEAERAAAEQAAAQKAAADKKVEDAKTWIRGQIKGDKLASADLDKQLRDAGFPGVVDLVFEEMQSGYSKGLTDPKKALEKVRAKLTKQARVLRTAGLVPKAPAPKTPSVSASKPRASAQTGAAGNGRAMTDAELRESVLREAGLWRN